jgi:Uma2 family endonuclease
MNETTAIKLPQQAAAPADEATPRLLRITAEQFEKMYYAGVFTYPNDRVVLREGLICLMNAQHIPHVTVKGDVLVALLDAVRSLNVTLRVDSEGSVRANDYNVPQPDIIVWEPLRARGAVPRERVRLAVEVTDTTHAEDLGYKHALYAGAGIPEYWVVDLRARIIRQHWDPVEGAYASARATPFGDDIASVAVPGLTISTATLRDLDFGE